MEQEQLEHRPLTFSELEDMLARHAAKAEGTKVIEDAMQRRLSDAATGMT